MMGFSGRGVVLVLVVAMTAWLSGCAARNANRAPIEERAPGLGTEAGAMVMPAPDQPPGFANAGKAGYYTVKPGDTMIRIGLETGQNWRDIARWNGLLNANVIEVGQVLLVTPPAPVAPVPPALVIASGRPVAGSGATTVPPQTGVTTGAISSSSMTTTAVPPGPNSAAAAAAAALEDEVALIWPASGSVLAGFDEVKNKGVDIGGSAGDPVMAAADGRVVYVGSSLRGYGNLIILKHNNTYLTAYAHNRALLVKEDQSVRKGQKIAEMGNSDADRVKLHFEVRRQGKPVDPAKYLPPR